MIRQLSIVALMLLAACAPSTEPPLPVEVELGQCTDRSATEYDDVSIRSLHIPMRDSVRIAVDLVLPDPLPEGGKLPAILMTRYWRSFEGDDASAVQRFFATRGYAVITGDSRGTGASFGLWPYHRAPDETKDFGEIVDWIVEQPWSSGVVGGFGTSYTANTADWLAQKQPSRREGHHSTLSRFRSLCGPLFPRRHLSRCFRQRLG